MDGANALLAQKKFLAASRAFSKVFEDETKNANELPKKRRPDGQGRDTHSVRVTALLGRAQAFLGLKLFRRCLQDCKTVLTEHPYLPDVRCMLVPYIHLEPTLLCANFVVLVVSVLSKIAALPISDPIHISALISRRYA